MFKDCCEYPFAASVFPLLSPGFFILFLPSGGKKKFYTVLSSSSLLSFFFFPHPSYRSLIQDLFLCVIPFFFYYSPSAFLFHSYYFTQKNLPTERGKKKTPTNTQNRGFIISLSSPYSIDHVFIFLFSIAYNLFFFSLPILFHHIIYIILSFLHFFFLLLGFVFNSPGSL